MMNQNMLPTSWSKDRLFSPTSATRSAGAWTSASAVPGVVEGFAAISGEVALLQMSGKFSAAAVTRLSARRPADARIPSMLRFHFTIWLGSFLLAGSLTAEQKNEPMKFGMVIHGGAGTIERSEMTAENEAAHRAGLEQALKAGYDVLERGGSSLDAVEAAIQVLEDNPLFNAGKGAVFTHEGTNELDSSIMDGKTLNAGAVASREAYPQPHQSCAAGHGKIAARHARRRRRRGFREENGDEAG